MIKKIYLTLLLVLSATFSAVQPVNAQYYSQGDLRYSLVIDKLVRPINEEIFYDNLSKEKYFSENDQVEFKLVISNKGDYEINQIEIKDSLPNYLDLIFFPGDWNKEKHEVVATIDKLGVGESKVYLIRGKISNAPVSNYQNYYFQTNKACVSSEFANDCDQSRYYITAKSSPDTGSSTLLIESVMIMSTVIAALKIRKIGRGF